jgi:uncharacterized membrane protein
MYNFQYIIAGCVSSVIGIIFIYSRKSILEMILKTQKDVDHLLKKENDYHKKTKYHFVPNLIIIIIGIALVSMGMLSVLMVL